MMYNPQLETFLCVVEAGSFSKAAEKMYITAPAVIKQINSLESSLNLQLFDRTHRGLIVTEAGKSLYKDTKYIIQYSKRFGCKSTKCNEREQRSDTGGCFTDDTATGVCGAMAKDSENVFRYQISDCYV